MRPCLIYKCAAYLDCILWPLVSSWRTETTSLEKNGILHGTVVLQWAELSFSQIGNIACQSSWAWHRIGWRVFVRRGFEEQAELSFSQVGNFACQSSWAWHRISWRVFVRRGFEERACLFITNRIIITTIIFLIHFHCEIQRQMYFFVCNSLYNCIYKLKFSNVTWYFSYLSVVCVYKWADLHPSPF